MPVVNVYIDDQHYAELVYMAMEQKVKVPKIVQRIVIEYLESQPLKLKEKGKDESG